MIGQDLPTSNISQQKGAALLKTLRLVFGILLSVVCIYFLLKSIEHEEVLARFKNVDMTVLLYAVGVTTISYLLRTLRWNYFFADSNFSFLLLFRALILGFFMNNVLPARIGELVRCHSLGKRVGLSRTFVLATVAAERLADGLTISALFGLCFYFSNLQTENLFYIGLVAWAFVGVSLAVVIGLLIREPVFRVVHKIENKINRKSFTFLISKLEKFIRGLEPLLQIKLVSKVVILSLMVWGVELFAYYLITVAFHENLSLGSLSLFLAAVNFSSLIPAAPGGVGVIENFASLALSKVGINYESAVAMVVAQHSIQYLVVGIPGLFFAVRNTKEVKTT